MFLDTYGRTPTNAYILTFLEKNQLKTKYNNRQIQSFQSQYCGEYCCLFALTMLTKNTSCFMSQFGKNFIANDKKIKELFTCNFEKSNCGKKYRNQGCETYTNCINKEIEKIK